MSREHQIAEQAAAFALLIDYGRVDPVKCNGQSGVVTILAEQAITFMDHYQRPGTDCWEAFDWYTETSDWFTQHIEELIYDE